MKIDEIRGNTLYDIINSRMLDVEKLITDAIPKAVSKTHSKRVKRRMEILLEADEDFIQALQHKLCQVIMEEQEKVHEPEKWMVKMAIGSEFLQEGNTFSKSVWLHLGMSIIEITPPFYFINFHNINPVLCNKKEG